MPPIHPDFPFSSSMSIFIFITSHTTQNITYYIKNISIPQKKNIYTPSSTRPLTLGTAAILDIDDAADPIAVKVAGPYSSAHTSLNRQRNSPTGRE